MFTELACGNVIIIMGNKNNWIRVFSTSLCFYMCDGGTTKRFAAIKMANPRNNVTNVVGVELNLAIAA